MTKNSLKIQKKRNQKAVHRRKTDHAISRRRKGQTTIYQNTTQKIKDCAIRTRYTQQLQTVHAVYA